MKLAIYASKLSLVRVFAAFRLELSGLFYDEPELFTVYILAFQ